MFKGTEDDQDERHDQGTINKVLGDTDTERGGDAPEEADRGAGLPEQIPLPSHPEFRPETSHHGMRIDTFEISDSGDVRSSTLDAIYTKLNTFKYALTESLIATLHHTHTCLHIFHVPLVTSNWLVDRGTHDREIFSSTHF